MPPEALLDSYRRDGYAFPVPVLSAHQAAAAASIVNQLAAITALRPVRLPFTHSYFPWAYDLAAHPALLDVVESLLGPDLLVWGTLILSKPAGSRSIVSWHQDCAYARFLDGSPALTAWIALTPATPQSGCMRVLPGSSGQRLPFTTDQQPDDMLIRGARVATEIDEAAAVDLILQSGEASLHEVSVIHGSNANVSDQPRVGFIVRYGTPAMRPTGYPVCSVRGNPGNFACQPPPREDSLPDYLDYLRRENN